MGRLIEAGPSANGSERRAMYFLRDNLPDDYVIISNFELRQGRGVFEIDLAIIAPHAIYLVDVKNLHGVIEVHGGNWYVEGMTPFFSPLAKLRRNAKILRTLMRGKYPDVPVMGKVVVQAIIILTSDNVEFRDPGGNDGPEVFYLENSLLFIEDAGKIASNRRCDLIPFYPLVEEVILGGTPVSYVKPHPVYVSPRVWIAPKREKAISEYAQPDGRVTCLVLSCLFVVGCFLFLALEIMSYPFNHTNTPGSQSYHFGTNFDTKDFTPVLKRNDTPHILKETQRFSGHTGPVNSVYFSHDGTRLLTASSDHTASIWDTKSGRELSTFSGHDRELGDAIFSPDETMVSTLGFGDHITIWNVATAKKSSVSIEDSIWRRGGLCRCLSYSPDGKELLVEGDPLAVYNTATGEKLTTLDDGRFRNSFSPDGLKIAADDGYRNVFVWDRVTRERMVMMTGHTANITRVVYSPDGKYLATASMDKTARIWEVRTGRELLVIDAHTAAVNDVAFSPDGTLLATAGGDNWIGIWSVKSGKLLLAIGGHVNAVNAVSFSPDGQYLASASDDQTMRLWFIAPHLKG